MSSTLVRKSQIRPLNIVRSDINTTTSGSALITKIIAGTGLTLSSSTGINPGTGDVTVALSIATASTLGGVKIGSGLTIAVDGTISVTSVSTSWGSITGLLSNQLDLQAALNAKYNIPTGTTSQYIDGTGALQTFPSALATGYVRHEVKAGVPIIKGQAVYVRSSDGTNMIVELASYDTEQTSSKTMGLLDRTVSTNSFANVITEGLLAGLDTTAAQAGDPVWLGPNGNLLYGIANKPHAPFHMVFIGIVTRVNANNGEIFVKVQNGYEIDELHDVLISGAVAGQLLRRDSDGLWKNWTPNYLTSFTETDPTVPAHVKAITTTNISNWNTAYSWGNHATQSYATQSYVNTAISNLIDTAPATLDTLNELAAALGDDPNFATTVTNNIATKVSKSGDTMTGNLNWAQTDRGITWGFNTDGAYIKFFNTGDGDTNSRLEYATFDNGDEYHRWLISNVERMTLRNEGLNVNGVVYSNGYGNSTEWNTAYGWGNHALAGYLTSVTNISGNAGTATILQTARTLTIGNTGKTFNGSANVAWTLSEIGAFSTAGGTISGVVTIESSSDGILNLKQLGIVGTAGTKNAGWNYIQFLDSEGDRQGYFGIDSAGNFQFASEITGLALIGSDIIATRPWVISQSYITASASITGNAATATTLQTARTINGTSFNGSANIETSYWGTTRTLTIGNTGKTVNGSGNQSWSLAEIGAQPAGSYAAASHTHDDRYYTETESDARFLRYYGINAETDFQRFQDGAGEIRFDQVNDYNNLSNAPGGYNYGGVLSMRGDNFGFQIWGSHTGELWYKTQWSGDQYSGWQTFVTSMNIGSQSVNYANSAGSVAWTNVSGRPTALSSFTNDSGYITTTGRAFPKRANGTNINFNIENGIVNSGNPTAILGTNNNIDIEAYSPAGLSVNYANSAGSVAWTNVSGRPTTVSSFTNDSGYITSAALSSYVPTSRTITINGVGYDLSANRSWTVSGTDNTKLPLAGGTMSGTIVLQSISGVEQTVPNNYGAYLHLGDWGIGRTDPRAVLVNTAYRADYAESLFDMNISRFTNNSGYITSTTNTINVNNGHSFVANGYNNNGGFAMNNASTYWGLMWNYASNDWRLGRGSQTAQNGWNLRWDASDNVYTNGTLNANYFRNGSVWMNNGADYNGYNENIRLFAAPNGVSVIAFNASGLSGTPAGGAILGYSDRLEFRKGGDAWQFRIHDGYTTTAGTAYAYGYRGNGNVGGTGEASWHPAGIYSGSTQWLYGNTYRNSANTYGQGQIYFDSNYGYGLVGLYSSTRYQAIFAMGDSYKLPVDGTSTGSLYGLAWSHPNAGGVAGNLNTHGLLVMENGTFLAAISGSIRARDDVRAPALYDSGNRVAISRGEGRNYVDYSRYVYNNGAYSGSGWVEPSDLGVRYAASANYATSAGSASSVAWGNISGKPGWMTSASLIESHSNANDWRNSGFYENDGGGSNWPSQTWYNSINVRHSNQGNYHGFQVAMSYYDNNLWFRSYQGSGSFQSWEYAISNRTIGSQSVNYASTSGTATNLSGFDKTNPSFGAVYSNNWFRSYGDTGLYSQDYGGHFRRSVSASYGTWEVFGYNKGGYAGINLIDPSGYWNNLMYENGNGGIYQQNGNGWHFYYSRGNSCLGLGTSTTSGSYRAYVAGSLYAEGDIVAYSDVRKKKDIVTIDKALEKVLKMRGVYYTKIYKENDILVDVDPNKRLTGVIAQEMNEVLPEVVNYASDIDEYGVSYGNIVGVLIEAIKEQQKEIEELKAKLN